MRLNKLLKRAQKSRRAKEKRTAAYFNYGGFYHHELKPSRKSKGPTIMWTGSGGMEPTKALLEAAIQAAEQVKEFSIVIPEGMIKDEDLEAMQKFRPPGCIRVVAADVAQAFMVESVRPIPLVKPGPTFYHFGP